VEQFQACDQSGSPTSSCASSTCFSCSFVSCTGQGFRVLGAQTVHAATAQQHRAVQWQHGQCTCSADGFLMRTLVVLSVSCDRVEVWAPTCRQTMLALSASTRSLKAPGSCTRDTSALRFSQALSTILSCQEVFRTTNRAVCRTKPDKLRTTCLFEEAAEACHVPAQDSGGRPAVGWRPHRRFIQRPCPHGLSGQPQHGHASCSHCGAKPIARCKSCVAHNGECCMLTWRPRLLLLPLLFCRGRRRRLSVLLWRGCLGCCLCLRRCLGCHAVSACVSEAL